MNKELFGIVRDIKIFKWGGFLILETFNGQYQCVLKHLDIAIIKLESYIRVIGSEVDATVKKELVISDKEIVVDSFEILSEPAEFPGINIYEKDINADIHLIFDQRALTLRNEKNKCIFKVQSYLNNTFRNFLSQQGFISIATPKIVSNGAEGGTNVFKFDYFGKEAYLAQSPQLYKQMMCGVFGKVYETGPVFRAEKHASSRHLNEYTSLDLEMILKKDFFELINIEKEMLYCMFYDIQRLMPEELKYLGVYIAEETSNPKNAVTFKVSKIKEILGTTGEDMSSNEEREIAKYAHLNHGTEFVFATHFHRDVKPFYTKISPDEITTESYDLIYKGVEITSGGQRKENYHEYIKAIQDAGMNQASLEGYLEAFKYGMPLHGGFAIGLERLTAGLCNLDSAKAATLFPRDVDRLTP